MSNHDDEHLLAERLKRLSGEQYEKFLIGVEIRKMRRTTNITQKSLAQKLKTTQSVIARIEQGKQNVTVKTLVKIAGIFGKKLFFGFR